MNLSIIDSWRQIEAIRCTRFSICYCWSYSLAVALFLLISRRFTEMASASKFFKNMPELQIHFWKIATGECSKWSTEGHFGWFFSIHYIRTKLITFTRIAIDLSGNYVTTNTVFHLRTTLNGMDLKFVSHGLWSEKQNILLRHMHKKEFWILTNKCWNNLKHENEAEGPWPVSLVLVFTILSTFNAQNLKFFFMYVLTKDVQLLRP